MKIIHGWADIDPAHKDRVDEAAKALETKSLTEPGNVHYGLSWSVDQPTRLCLIEIWVDDAAHHTHTQEQNVKSFSQLASQTCLEPPTFFTYDGTARS